MQIKNFGEKYLLYELKNKNGIILKLIDIGASISGVFMKDKNNNEIQISFGSDDYNFYLKAHDYIGSSVGRVANRIINGEFKLNNKIYKLAKNDNNKHHLHGGIEGISFKKFDSKNLDDKTVLFSYLSKDGEEGYPANLKIEITYSLTEDNEIIIKYFAKADSPTPINLTNHSYWNLNGEGLIYEHDLFIDSKFYLPVNEEYISTGEILKTKNTPFDFNKTKKIGADIEKVGGYDNCFIFDSEDINKLRAKAFSEKTGISLELYTTKPAMHFYSGNMLNGIKTRGAILNKHNAFCFETEFLPAALNFIHFPNIILKANEEYNQKTIYKLCLES